MRRILFSSFRRTSVTRRANSASKHVAVVTVKIMRSFFICCFAAASLISVRAASNLPAFPGAEGFGANTPGGRGGQILIVTNLDDSGPGSLREACLTEGPRIVVFRVAGTIALKSPITVTEPYFTLEAQSAPGDGICLLCPTFTRRSRGPGPI